MQIRPDVPTVMHELFLGASGFLGLRCGCGFLVTGRTAVSLEANINDHARFRHLDELISQSLDHDEDTLEP